MEIAVRQGSLTAGDEDVWVNASNTNVSLGSGVSAAIRAACGPAYQDHIAAALAARFGGPMPPGAVLLTDAGSARRARHVAHCAVMDYRAGFSGVSFPTLDTIRACCTNLVDELERLPGPVSVAMVALGAGTGQLGVRAPTQVACETFREHAQRAGSASRIARVVFYGFTLPEFAAVADEVCSHFPSALASVPTEVQALFTKAR